MNSIQIQKWFLAASICSLIFCGCKSTAYSYAVKGEKLTMKIDERPGVVNYTSLKASKIPSFAERAAGNSRGVPFVSEVVSLATEAIKKVIANERKKYVADYNFALTDLYFYDQLSTESAFDPVGMQFGGLILLRTFISTNGTTDTAFFARFILDTTHTSELINNSVFRLRVKDLKLTHSKAKITKGQKKLINMDVEITFTTSYVNEWGQLFDNIEIGKFYLLLRNIPLDKNSPDYADYYKKLENTPLIGKSFIVPRSFGNHFVSRDHLEKCFSQGNYTVTVKIKESSKDKFVTKLLVDNRNTLIDALGKQAKDGLSPKAKPVKK